MGKLAMTQLSSDLAKRVECGALAPLSAWANQTVFIKSDPATASNDLKNLVFGRRINA